MWTTPGLFPYCHYNEQKEYRDDPYETQQYADLVRLKVLWETYYLKHEVDFYV